MDIFAAIERLGLPVVLIGLAGVALYKLIDRMTQSAQHRSVSQDTVDEKQIAIIDKALEQNRAEQAWNRSLQERWFDDQKVNQEIQRALTEEFKLVGTSLRQA